MGIFDRIEQRYEQAKIIAEKARDFVLGEGVVDPFWQLGTGKDKELFTPAIYGNYIATSNPVYSVITLRADLLSSLPLKIYRLEGDDKVEVTTGAFRELLTHVNPHWTYNRLIKMSEQSLGLWGECFWFLERGESGRGAPREIWWARPDRVKVIPHATDYISKFIYEPLTGGEVIEFDPSEVVWFRYPNALDEFSGLSPLAAARLSADVNSAAMHTNFNLFKQGMLMGGFVLPPKENTYGVKQAGKLEQSLKRRFQGTDKAHRWAVMLEDAQIHEMSMTNRDAEFLGALAYTLDDVARAYKVPVDLIGGERTYKNLGEAERAVWTRAIKPEAIFIAEEINEQLASMFPPGKEFAEFDDSNIDALHEAETDKWKRSEGQIKIGAITINEWRNDQGLDPVEWGDVPPVTPMLALTPKAEDDKKKADEDEDDDDRSARNLTREIIYKSNEHLIHWRKHVRKGQQYERRFGEATKELFTRQRDSVIDRLKSEPPRAKAKRTPGEAVSNPFDIDEWVKKFREAIRSVLEFIVADSGADALEEAGLTIDFDLTDPAFNRFIEQSAQRFAKEVNDITWKQLKKSLSDGISEGESIEDLAKRVDFVMGDRIKSSATTIARTEVNAAVNGGRLLSWAQSGVVSGKAWLAALDDVTRDSHVSAHKTYQAEPIPLTQDFQVGNGSGPTPGQIGVAEEDINCRCTMIPVVDERAYRLLTGRAPDLSKFYLIEITDEARLLDQLDVLATTLEAKL